MSREYQIQKNMKAKPSAMVTLRAVLPAGKYCPTSHQTGMAKKQMIPVASGKFTARF